VCIAPPAQAQVGFPHFRFSVINEPLSKTPETGFELCRLRTIESSFVIC
jgi:hypothetical protein